WASTSLCHLSSITPLSRAVSSRTLDPGDGSVSPLSGWSYTWSPQSADGTASNVNVATDPAQNDTVYTISPAVTNTCSFYETQVQHYTGHPSGGTLLKTEKTQYSGVVAFLDTGGSGVAVNVKPTIVTTDLPSGKTSQIKKFYDCDTNYACANSSAIYGDVLEEDEYDYGISPNPGALLRKTSTSYTWQNDGNFRTLNMVDLPASVAIYDSGGIEKSLINYQYDQYGTSNQFGHSLALVSPGVAMQHDSVPINDTIAAPAKYRGNVTTVSRCQNPPACSHSINSKHSYLDTGMVNWSEDPLGNRTSFTYSAA